MGRTAHPPLRSERGGHSGGYCALHLPCRRRSRTTVVRTSMQVAGSKCAVCCRQVVFADEGAACGGCGTVVHRNCLAERSSCPSCHCAWVDADSSPAFAVRCAVCGRPNAVPPDVVCRTCGSLLRYDSAQALNCERKRIHHFARWRIAECLILFGVGGVLVAFAGRVLTTAWPWFSIPIAVFCGAGAWLVWSRAVRAGREAALCLAFK